MKYLTMVQIMLVIIVAPARERGLKYAVNIMRIHMSDVAPARERGLKCFGYYSKLTM